MASSTVFTDPASVYCTEGRQNNTNKLKMTHLKVLDHPGRQGQVEHVRISIRWNEVLFPPREVNSFKIVNDSEACNVPTVKRMASPAGAMLPTDKATNVSAKIRVSLRAHKALGR